MKCLIVDDDAVSRNIFKTILAKYAKCDLVSNGTNAIAAYKTSLDKGKPYDLIILDIMMPDINGDEVLKFIRFSEKAKNIYFPDCAKVIIATGLDDFKNRQIEKNLNKESEAFLLKSPGIHQELLNTIRKLGFNKI